LPPAVRRLAENPRGLVLVTGPTGSGKTTTLAAMIDHINETMSRHIVTVEDPIEVLHTDKQSVVNQREIGTDTADFHAALKRVLRQDPDVILIGEMRDPETVKTALSAAETGHLVFSTLHTISATETINRIIDFFPPHEQRQVRMAVAGALRGIVSQRLVECRDGQGRIPAVEVLVATGRVFDKIVNADETHEIDEIIADGEYYGMQSFDQALLALYLRGAIELREALAASSRPHDLRLLIEQHTLAQAG
jgi:twitching motility protein PilT